MIKTKLKNRNLSQEDVFNFSELFKLMKPRVMSLVIFTCAVGLLMAPNVISTKDAIIGIILVSIGAGAAGALNMWYESDLDALMTRTCLRPIPTGKVNKNQALVFGVALSIFSAPSKTEANPVIFISSKAYIRTMGPCRRTLHIKYFQAN